MTAQLLTTATKRCARCRYWRLATAFARCSGTRDGLQAWCRGCKTTDMRLRRARQTTGARS